MPPLSALLTVAENPLILKKILKIHRITTSAGRKCFSGRGKLAAMGIILKRLSLIKKDDPKVSALLSLFLASENDMNATKTELVKAKLSGNSAYALYAEAMILRLEKKFQPRQKRSAWKQLLWMRTIHIHGTYWEEFSLTRRKNKKWHMRVFRKHCAWNRIFYQAI